MSLLPLLVVDDDPVVRGALVKVLRQALPIDIADFGHGAEALAFAARDQPGLALLDVDMVPMNGLELAKGLRSLYPQLPLMFLTGSVDEDLRGKFCELGAVQYRKPLGSAELIAAVESHRIRR